MAAKKNNDLAFAYEGKDKQGRMVKGEVVSPSEAIAKAQLRKQGITPNKLKQKRKKLRVKKLLPAK